MKIKALGIGLFLSIFSLPLGAQDENASAQISPLSPRENGPPSLSPPVIASPYFLPQPPQIPPPLLLPPSRFDSEEPLRRPIYVPLPESFYHHLGTSLGRYLEAKNEKIQFKKIGQEDLNRLLFRNIFDGPSEFVGYGKTMAEVIQSDATRTGNTVALGNYSNYSAIQISDPVFGAKVEIVRLTESAKTKEKAEELCKNLPPVGSWKLPTEEFIMGVLNKYEVAYWEDLLPSIHFSKYYAEVNGFSLKLKASTKYLDGTPLWVQPEEDRSSLILISQIHPFKAKDFSMTELIEAGTTVNTDSNVLKEEDVIQRQKADLENDLLRFESKKAQADGFGGTLFYRDSSSYQFYSKAIRTTETKLENIDKGIGSVVKEAKEVGAHNRVYREPFAAQIMAGIPVVCVKIEK